jgi:tetratricopeptide (TPR) repeat protein
MWQADEWLYSKAIAYVQLGQCPLGVEFLTNEANKELGQLSKEHLSNYLHNLGVTLLCSNRIDEAKEKLRSAYRVENNSATLRMLGLASKISEWQLSAEVDRSPEIQQLFSAGPPDPSTD